VQDQHSSLWDGGITALFERVEDEIEAVRQRRGEVVADLGDVAGDDLREVGEGVRELAELPLGLEFVVLFVRLTGTSLLGT
jgi:hypothetical protein